PVFSSTNIIESFFTYLIAILAFSCKSGTHGWPSILAPTRLMKEPRERLRMPTTHLTDISIKAVRAPVEGQITYWDSSLPAFGIRVSQGGTKTWTVVHGEKRKRISIGRYPVISLQQARSEAKRVL